MIRVLMIEDDPDFSEYLSEYLMQHHIEVTTIDDPYYVSTVAMKNFDLVILDLTLPGIDGLDLCKEIRQKYAIPIIISSARGDITDKIIAFERGADDYVPKPYNPKELYARIQSILRRSSVPPKEESKKRFCLLGHDICEEGETLDLTLAEKELLTSLIERYFHTVTRETIVEACETLNDVHGKSIDMLISRLRQKLKDPSSIVTVRGLGYKLVK